MNKFPFLLILFSTPLLSRAQFVIGTAGITVQAGATLTVDSLVLRPTSALTLTSNEIQRSRIPVGSTSGITSLKRVYQFATPVSFSGTLGFFFADSELAANIKSSLEMAFRTENGWTTTSGSSVNTATNFVSQTLSNITFNTLTATSSPTPLPVSLLAFHAKKQGDRQALLSWDVSREERLSHYEIQRSNDGRLFRKIGTVVPTRANSYVLADERPATGLNYYRLLLVAPDGASKHSPTRLLVFSETAAGLQVVPNPVINELIITSPAAYQGQTARVTDVTGKQVTSFQLEDLRTIVPAIDWLPGIYMICIGDTSFKIEKR